MQLSMQFAILFKEILNLFNLKVLLFFKGKENNKKIVIVYLFIKDCKEMNIFNEKMGRRSGLNDEFNNRISLPS